MNEIKTLGERITELLEKNSMTQRELAELVGVTTASMSRYISNDRTPKGPIIANIATALHTTTDYLLGSEGEADFENEYYKIHRLIARNASQMTAKQRNALINALLEESDD